MRQVIWLMCTLVMLACCGLVDAGAREKLAIAAAVDALLQSNTPALPDTLNGGGRSGERFHNIGAAEEKKAPAVEPLVIYAPTWCGVCKAMRAYFKLIGLEYGTDKIPLKWVESEAPFVVPAYPFIHDPKSNMTIWGRKSFEEIAVFFLQYRK